MSCVRPAPFGHVDGPTGRPSAESQSVHVVFYLPVDFEDAMKLVLSGCSFGVVDRETKLPVEALGDVQLTVFNQRLIDSGRRLIRESRSPILQP
jgi:hypothetical protein